MQADCTQEKWPTFEHNDYCVTQDAECGDQHQDREDVGANGICQLQLWLWGQKNSTLFQLSEFIVEAGGFKWDPSTLKRTM